jgi:hypothetical protein
MVRPRYGQLHSPVGEVCSRKARTGLARHIIRGDDPPTPRLRGSAARSLFDLSPVSSKSRGVETGRGSRGDVQAAPVCSGE